MKITIKIGVIRTVLIVMSILGIWTSSCHAEGKNLDVILLMDSSGSMKYTDPNKLRASAAKLFVSLLEKNDRASIVSFSDLGYPVAYLTDLNNPLSQTKLFSAIDKISTKGVYTNLSGAVETAIKVLKRKPKNNRKRIIILMSDGKIDMENTTISEQLTAKLINQQIPELRKLGIILNTIAFTEHSDKSLMKQLAKESGGSFYLANTDKALRSAYTAMFEQSKAPNQTPFNGDTFTIDASVSETTIIGTKASKSTTLTLISPSGDSYNKISNINSMTWHTADTYDIITIKKPSTGKWKLVASDGDNKAYIVSDLQLYVSHEPKIPKIGEGVVIKAWLQSGKNIISKKEILDGVSINLEAITPDDKTHQLTMEPYSQFSDDASSAGIFASHIAFPSTGQFKITITFNSSTFARQKVVFIDIQTPTAADKILKDAIKEKQDAQPKADHTEANTEHVTEGETEHKTSTPDSHPDNIAHHDEPVSSPVIAPIEHAAQRNELKLPKLPNITGVDPSNTSESNSSHSKVAEDHVAQDNRDEGYKKYSKDSDTHTESEKEKNEQDNVQSTDDKKTHTEDLNQGGSSTMMAIIAFVGINFLLISAGIGGYFLYNRRKAKAIADAEQELINSEDNSEDYDNANENTDVFEPIDNIPDKEHDLATENDANKKKVA